MATRKPPTTSASAFPKAPMSGARIHERFDLGKEPNEANRFGWIVEVDVDRSELGAEEAHRARPLQARGRRIASSPRTAASSSISATTSASTMSTSSSPRARSTPTTAPPTWTCSTAARSMSRSSPTTARSPGCRWCFGQGPLTAENGFAEPGRRADRDAPRRPTCSAPPRWTGRRTSSPTASTARSM